MGFEITEAITTAIRALDESAWQPALTADGVERDRAHVVELTDTVALPASWPEPARLIVRPLHPGAQQTIDHLDGCRLTAVLTDQTEVDIVAVERRHRARARAEDRIRAL